MEMATVTKRWTLDDLNALPDDGNKYEVVRGDSGTWSSAPIPSLIVEVFSRTTRRRDVNQKRDLHMDAEVGEYWMVDPDRRALIVVRKGRENELVTGEMMWHPESAREPLTFDVARVFA